MASNKVTHAVWTKSVAKDTPLKVSATMDFGMIKPRCDHCKNIERLPTVKINANDKWSHANVKLCLNCVQGLLVGMHEAIEKNKLHHLIETGQADVVLLDKLTSKRD